MDIKWDEPRYNDSRWPLYSTHISGQIGQERERKEKKKKKTSELDSTVVHMNLTNTYKKTPSVHCGIHILLSSLWNFLLTRSHFFFTIRHVLRNGKKEKERISSTWSDRNRKKRKISIASQKKQCGVMIEQCTLKCHWHSCHWHKSVIDTLKYHWRNEGGNWKFLRLNDI